MLFAKSLIVCATLFASSSIAELIAFSELPQNPVSAGSKVPLAWSGADDDTVTILLKQGPPGNLDTVSGANGLITGNARRSFTWNVPRNIKNGNNYALQITRNVVGAPTEDDNNYTGTFSITGGSSSSGPSSESSSASSSSSSSSTASSSASSSGRSIIAGAGAGSQSSSASASSASTLPSAANATMTSVTAAPSGAVGTGAGASGSGMSMSRNTTMSRASLSRTSSSASSSETASSTSGMGEPTSSSSDTAPSSSPTTGTAISLASNFALLFAAVIAVVYLG